MTFTSTPDLGLPRAKSFGLFFLLLLTAFIFSGSDALAADPEVTSTGTATVTTISVSENDTEEEAGETGSAVSNADTSSITSNTDRIIKEATDALAEIDRLDKLIKEADYTVGNESEIATITPDTLSLIHISEPTRPY